MFDLKDKIASQWFLTVFGSSEGRDKHISVRINAHSSHGTYEIPNECMMQGCNDKVSTHMVCPFPNRPQRAVGHASVHSVGVPMKLSVVI